MKSLPSRLSLVPPFLSVEAALLSDLFKTRRSQLSVLLWRSWRGGIRIRTLRIAVQYYVDCPRLVTRVLARLLHGALRNDNGEARAEEERLLILHAAPAWEW